MSFKDTFTRNSSGKQNLQYDDVAFHHFFITILLVVLVPLVYSMIKSIINPFGHLPRLKDIQKKKQFQDKVQRFKRQNKHNYVTCGFLLKIILLVALTYGIIFSFHEIQASSQDLKGFDPYEILGVQEDAPVQKIKKAYRKLALLYHPDRNKDDPSASAKFIMISKAYECLTDEAAKQKCLKYGNPQGSQSFNVGIALPSFLIKKQNHVIIMGIVFVLVVIILPAFLIHYQSNMNKFDDFGMLIENYTFIHGFLNQHYNVSDCVKTLAICNQFRQLKTTKSQIPKLQAMLNTTQQDVQKALKKKNFLPYIKKSMLLISARVNEQQIASQLEQDYKFILKKLPVLIKATIMIGFSRSLQNFPYQQKFVGFNALYSLILFGQHFIQGKTFKISQSFEQLPLTNDEAIVINKKKKNHKITSLDVLLSNPSQQQYLLSLLSQNRKAVIKESLQYFPRNQLTVNIKTQDNGDIAIYDAFKVVVNAKSNKIGGYCNSNKYPFLKTQGYYLIVQNNNQVVFLQHFNFDQTSKQFKFDYRHDKVNNYSLNCHLFSDCYFGLDQLFTLKYDVKQARKFQEEPEKPQSDEDQSFFSKMMSSIIPTQQEEVSDKQDNQDEQKKVQHPNNSQTDNAKQLEK